MRNVASERTSPICIIFPAHNEARNIERVLRAYTHYFTHPKSRFRVVVNASTDATFALARKLSRSDNRICVTDTPDAIGKGGAILHGMAESSSELFVGFVDADGSVSPKEFAKLVHALMENADTGIAIASRWVPGAKFEVKQTFSRQLLSRLFNVCIRRYYGLPYLDTQCGAKLWRMSAHQKLAPLLRETSFTFDIELLWRAQQLGIRVVEVPIHWRDIPGSSVRPLKIALPMLRSLRRIRHS